MAWLKGLCSSWRSWRWKAKGGWSVLFGDNTFFHLTVSVYFSDCYTFLLIWSVLNELSTLRNGMRWIIFHRFSSLMDIRADYLIVCFHMLPIFFRLLVYNACHWTKNMALFQDMMDFIICMYLKYTSVVVTLHGAKVQRFKVQIYLFPFFFSSFWTFEKLNVKYCFCSICV